MKLLSTKKELNGALIGIIEQSQKELIIISPFIHFSKNYLNEKLKGKKNFLEIYTKLNGKTMKENDDAFIALKELVASEDKIFLIDHLHAKIYINDKSALLSSMNFNDDAFAKSLDFGIITEDNKEYDAVINYCNENIFCYNKKTICDYFLAHNIVAKFEGNSCLTLKKDGKTLIQCHIGINSNKLKFYFDLPRNTTSKTSFNIIHNISKKHSVKISRSPQKGLSVKRYYFHLDKDKCSSISLIPIIISQNNIRGVLTDVCNCLE